MGEAASGRTSTDYICIDVQHISFYPEIIERRSEIWIDMVSGKGIFYMMILKMKPRRSTMKRIMLVVIAVLFLFAPLAYANSSAISVPSSVTTVATAPGPAPSAGDGVSEGSEWDDLDNMLCVVFPELCQGIGPAPNAGDGVSDGSGF